MKKCHCLLPTSGLWVVKVALEGQNVQWSAWLFQQRDTPTLPPIVSLMSMPPASSPKGAVAPLPSLLGQEEAPYDLTFFQPLAIAMDEFDSQFFATHEDFNNFGGHLLSWLGEDSSNLREEDYYMGGGGLKSITWPTKLLHFSYPPCRQKKRQRKERHISFYWASEVTTEGKKKWLCGKETIII